MENLKISKVIPVFKDKGSYLECNNHRPISLLSNIIKIIEKLMHERLYSFLSKHKCICDRQFGFRSRHSTNHALLDLTEDIRDAMDNNKFAVGVFVDLQKAFDTVDHNILLKKLDHYGIRGVANNWFKSYLSNRKQFVIINGVNSDLQSMKFGVPQGSPVIEKEVNALDRKKASMSDGIPPKMLKKNSCVCREPLTKMMAF